MRVNPGFGWLVGWLVLCFLLTGSCPEETPILELHCGRRPGTPHLRRKPIPLATETGKRGPVIQRASGSLHFIPLPSLPGPQAAPVT